jgi:hypothetical protein
VELNVFPNALLAPIRKIQSALNALLLARPAPAMQSAQPAQTANCSKDLLAKQLARMVTSITVVFAKSAIPLVLNAADQTKKTAVPALMDSL